MTPASRVAFGFGFGGMVLLLALARPTPTPFRSKAMDYATRAIT